MLTSFTLLSKARASLQCPSPLAGGVRAVQWVLEVDDGAVPVLKNSLLLSVILHQFCQRRKLFPSVQVIEVPRVLDPNMGHLVIHPAGYQEVRLPIEEREWDGLGDRLRY